MPFIGDEANVTFLPKMGKAKRHLFPWSGKANLLVQEVCHSCKKLIQPLRSRLFT